jgi:hypothetical protein
MHKKHAPGCPCCACNGNITVVVVDQCGGGINGASVTVKQGGVTVGTCTTDASGTCSVPITLGGVYDITATATGYGGGSGTVTVSACTGGTVGGYIVITLTKNGGPWICCPTGCPPSSPIPTTLYLTAGPITSLPLVYNAMASQGLTNAWAACTAFTSPYVSADCCHIIPGGPFSTPLVFKLRCPPASNPWKVEIDYCGCVSGIGTGCTLTGLAGEACANYPNWFHSDCLNRRQQITGDFVAQDSATACDPFHFVGTSNFVGPPICGPSYVHPLARIFPFGTTFTITQ